MTDRKLTKFQAREIHEKFIEEGLYRMSIDQLRCQYVLLKMENTVLRMNLKKFTNDRRRGSTQKKINHDMKTYIARLLAVHVLHKEGTLSENSLKRERDQLENEQLTKEGIYEQPPKPMIPDSILDKALSFIKSEKKKLGC